MTRLLIITFLIISKYTFAQLPFTQQTYGGSEIIFKHRPDISDSTYQIYFNVSMPCMLCSGVGYGLGYSPIVFNLYDTCNYNTQQILIGFSIVGNSLILNPFTTDSAKKRIFKVCSPGFPEFITGANYNIINPGFKDTFENIKDYWFSTLLTLPEKCGHWQIASHNYSNSICNNNQVISMDVQQGTNLDSTDYYNTGPYIGVAYNIRGITQINANVANSSPYFLSYNVAHYPKNTLVSYQQNAVDPDGDSLVWSSLHMVWYDTVHGIKPLSYWAPFIPQKECLSAPYYNMPLSPVSSGLKKVPGYACIPGTGSLPTCIKYDPVYNPFDTDSTYSLNPQTGEVSFVAKSAPQTARLLLRCDEYRQGVWVGAVNRRVDFFITDSMYYNTPTFSIDTANLVNCYLDSPYVFYACKNQPLSIPFSVKSNTNLSYLRVVDNHSMSMPTSILSYQNNVSDSVRGVLQWTPSNSDTGWHQVLVRAYDSACSVTPYIQEHSYLLRIYVSSGLQLNASDTTLCAGNSVQLQVSGLGNNVTWSVLSGSANSLSCTQCASPWATPTQSSVYVVSATSTGLSCVSNDTVKVGVIQDFTLQATDTIVCFNKDVILQAHASGNNTSLQYQWTPTTGIIGGNNNAFIVAAPSTTNYIVTVSDSLACFTHIDTASMYYDTSFHPIITVDKNGICTGDTVTIDVQGSVNSIAWSPNYHISTLTGAQVKVWPDSTVQYEATIIGGLNNACKQDVSEEIKVTALRADAGPDYEIFDGESVVLGGPNMLCGDGCSLQWFPDQWLFFNFMKNPKAVPHVNTTYWVMVRNETGNCIDRDSVTVKVKCTDIYMPNAFNPESLGSDFTKTFGPRNVSLQLDYFRIFNRWGELVFQTNDVGYRWDGKYKGQPQPVGTYVWIIRGKCPNGELWEKKGNVLLVR